MATRVPLVDYLALEPQPHLTVNECVSCEARVFGRRNACPACSESTFTTVALDPIGELVTFTIVHQAAPGIEVPFVAGIVDCGGTLVAARLVNVVPDPCSVTVGMRVRLIIQSLGRDEVGTEAIGFGFEPVGSVAP